VNLLGPFRLTRILAGAMAVGEGGLVVHISSDAAVSAYPTWGAYGVSKAALDHLGRVWAAELEEHGVRFLTVDPGDMNTDLHREAAPEDDPSSLLDPGEVAERLVALMEAADTLPGGARIALGDWRAPRVAGVAS
jgi:NAD(P)-dependent dehydrogenase (short-subunit alcohol dehydrogenase family)